MEKVLNKDAKIFLIGAAAYPVMEILWRGRTHPSMAAVGGVCFLCISKLSGKMRHRSLWQKCAAGTCTITAVEFVSGIILNRQLKLGVWDYSKLPMNLMGQICLPYCALWYAICIPAFKLAAALD